MIVLWQKYSGPEEILPKMHFLCHRRTGEGDVALERAKKVCEKLRVLNLVVVSFVSVESFVEHSAIPREDCLVGG